MTDTAFTAEARLAPDEIAAYREDGIVVPRHRLSEARVGRLREALDRVIADNPAIRPERLISAHLESGTEGVKGSRVFLDLAFDSDILDLVGQLIGPDFALWGCQIFCKQQGDGLEVPWHQDGHYWPIRPLATCTAWIAIDASLRENGCLRVIPGSHRSRTLFAHLKEDRQDLALDQVLVEGTFDEGAARDIELEPGQMSLHDVFLIHGSRPNRSPRRRAGIALRYMPTSSHFDRTVFQPRTDAGGLTIDFSTRPLWLVRGTDRSGRNTGFAPRPV